MRLILVIGWPKLGWIWECAPSVKARLKLVRCQYKVPDSLIVGPMGIVLLLPSTQEFREAASLLLLCLWNSVF